MARHNAKLIELGEMKKDVSRALVEIWRGARLVRDGVDVTEAHKMHLQSVVADIDVKISACDGDDSTPAPSLL